MNQEAPVSEVEVAILGGGICGIGAGITLKKMSRPPIDDFVILERAEELGGTWTHNTYPGCAVDIPSHLYSFSFAMNPDWSRTFAEQPELKRYAIETAERFGLSPHVRFGTEVLDASWDDEDQRWSIETTEGRLRARFLIVAAGPLHEPEIPDLPGLSSFRGEMFHSSRWPADLSLAGRRVAVIGNGASALQFVPAIQPEVESLTIFQRTPSWVMPKLDWRTTRLERAAMRYIPGLMRLARWAEWAPIDLLISTLRHPRIARLAHPAARWNIRRAIKDPELRRTVTPDYTVGCKRTGISNTYYPALAQPNVSLVASAVSEVRAGSVLAADGSEHAVDTIIFGTGFKVLTTHPVAARIHGRAGSLASVWNGSPRAYNGTVIAGFPNLFMMFGPNIGTASGFVMAEAQFDYIASALRAVMRHGLASIEVRADAQDAFVSEMDEALAGSVFVVGGCSSYYLDATGRPALPWPYTMAAMRRRLRRFDLTAFNSKLGISAEAVGPPDRDALRPEGRPLETAG